jgi:hypothetical protein
MASVKRYVCDLRESRGMCPDELGAWAKYADIKAVVQEAYAVAYERGKKEGYFDCASDQERFKTLGIYEGD